MDYTKICNTYFAMHKALIKETQLQAKIDLNRKLGQFKDENNIIIVGSQPELALYIDGAIRGFIRWKYSKRKVSLCYNHIGYTYHINY
jgi:hypothetical protein